VPERPHPNPGSRPFVPDWPPSDQSLRPFVPEWPYLNPEADHLCPFGRLTGLLRRVASQLAS